jgi:dipeptidyl aminopeptidase/acylaminoacyl peptidase
VPKGEAGARKPAVIFFHGGSRRQMLLGWHYMYYYSNAYALNQYLASEGYVVLSVNYRSGIGYGLNFREALNYGATGGSEYADVLAAGVYLRGRRNVDPARIGLWGGSYGGYLTALGGGAGGVGIVADSVSKRLAQSGAADSWRRRSQREIQPDGGTGASAAQAEGGFRAVDLPRRGPRFPDSSPLGRVIQTSGGFLRTQAAEPRSGKW